MTHYINFILRWEPRPHLEPDTRRLPCLLLCVRPQPRLACVVLSGAHGAAAQRAVDKGKDVNVPAAVNKDTITRGLRYSVSTGNWGQQGTAGIRAGVSQVR